jgi:hypothetical protein
MPGQCWFQHAPGARQQFLHLDRDAVAAHDDGALGHRQVVGENADLVRLGGIEREDGAATEAQDLVDRHRGLAQRTTAISIETFSSVAKGSSRDFAMQVRADAVSFDDGMVFRWLRRAAI